MVVNLRVVYKIKSLYYMISKIPSYYEILTQQGFMFCPASKQQVMKTNS